MITGTHRMRILKRRRLFQPKKQSPIASAPGNMRLARRELLAGLAEVTTERVVLAAAPEGVKIAGEKLHEAPEGRPEQLKETGESNPFDGVIEIVVAPLCPAVTVRDGEETATAKSGGGRWIV